MCDSGRRAPRALALPKFWKHPPARSKQHVSNGRVAHGPARRAAQGYIKERIDIPCPAAAITRGRSNPNEKAHRACDRSRTDCFRWCMGLCLLRGDVKHDARCGLASSICGYSRIAVDRLEWFQTLGRLLCYVDFSLCANRNRIPNDPVASKDRRRGTDPFFAYDADYACGHKSRIVAETGAEFAALRRET